MKLKILLFLLLVLSLYPSWVWCAGRFSDNLEEPWHLVALLCAMLVALRAKSRQGQVNLALMSVMVVAYIAAALAMPRLAQGVIAVCAVAAFISQVFLGRRLDIRLLGCLLLALPAMSSMQFFLGYPLRWLVTGASAFFLHLAGFAVTVDGASMQFAGQCISVDAPCSGVRMLWSGAFLTCVLSFVYGLSTWRTAVLSMTALVSVFGANVFRVLSLFYAEQLPAMRATAELPSYYHDAVGVFAFMLCAGILLFSARRLALKGSTIPKAAACLQEQAVSKWIGRIQSAPTARSGAASLGRILLWQERTAASCINDHKDGPSLRPCGCGLRAAVAGRRFSREGLNGAARPDCCAIYGVAPFVVACLIACTVPLMPAVEPAAASVKSDFPGWPRTFEGRPLTELPLSKLEDRFARGFPGLMARFSDGCHTLIIRWIARETRQLHPSADCFRSIGYSIKPLALFRDKEGKLWERFLACRNGATFLVRERIFNGHDSWTDVSSWYWSAALGHRSGPFWAVTVVERPQGADPQIIGSAESGTKRH